MSSCPRRMDAGNKNTFSMHHPRIRNVTTYVVRFKTKSHTHSNLTKSGETQRYSWERRKRMLVVVSYVPVANIHLHPGSKQLRTHRFGAFLLSFRSDCHCCTTQLQVIFRFFLTVSSAAEYLNGFCFREFGVSPQYSTPK